MPFIEDENGLAIYFTRDEWEVILKELEDSLEIVEYWEKKGLIVESSTHDKMLCEIVYKIRKHIP